MSNTFKNFRSKQSNISLPRNDEVRRGYVLISTFRKTKKRGSLFQITRLINLDYWKNVASDIHIVQIGQDLFTENYHVKLGSLSITEFYESR